MKRHTITLGASTTAGGKVISASSTCSINGVEVALEGDSVFCPACKATGVITCVDPRIPETWNGKKIALEHDLCRCKCQKLPRLLPNQWLKYQNLSGASESNTSSDGLANTTTDGNAQSMFDDKFVLLDEATGQPLCGAQSIHRT